MNEIDLQSFVPDEMEFNAEQEKLIFDTFHKTQDIVQTWKEFVRHKNGKQCRIQDIETKLNWDEDCFKIIMEQELAMEEWTEQQYNDRVGLLWGLGADIGWISHELDIDQDDAKQRVISGGWEVTYNRYIDPKSRVAKGNRKLSLHQEQHIMHRYQNWESYGYESQPTQVELIKACKEMYNIEISRQTVKSMIDRLTTL